MFWIGSVWAKWHRCSVTAEAFGLWTHARFLIPRPRRWTFQLVRLSLAVLMIQFDYGIWTCRIVGHRQRRYWS
ncbi:hypothetical protein T02_9565, partial [Trichinella nativa]